MNYALLRKYKYGGDSQELGKVFAQSAITLRSKKVLGGYEVVLYLSDSEPNVFFSMSLWFTLEELMTTFKRPTTLQQIEGVELIEQSIFELIEEYRKLDTKIVASFIRVIRHLKPQIISRTLQSNSEGKKRAQQLPGYIGGWVGLCMSDPHLLLTRADWSSQIALEAFLADKAPDSLVKWYFSQGGVPTEYASYNLQMVISLIS